MVELHIGLEQIRSYKRLAYTPWHALAEFVDNSTQSYFDNREALDKVFEESGEQLEVSINLSNEGDGHLRIVDNAMGMSFEQLERALVVGLPPEHPDGRSRYGLGLKTGATWFGDVWTVRTKRLGDTEEHEVTVDVERVAQGDADLRHVARSGREPKEHYTIIDIYKLNRKPQGRTRGKIKDYLRSMYRVDIRSGILMLLWQGERLTWEPDELFVQAADGSFYRRDFSFEVDGKAVSGWVGVLERGSRAKAGFSILHANRVVRGWPDSWRPESIFGQELGSNDLINQRLTGEIHLDAFDVSHTKDDILWLSDEQHQVEDALRTESAEYREFAQRRRKRDNVTPGPDDLDVQTAVRELEAELSSSQMVDAINVDVMPTQDVVASTLEVLKATIDPADPTFSAVIATGTEELKVLGYLSYEASPNDPYVWTESTTPERVMVVINMQHPHLQQVAGDNGLLDYFRHCTYDALAEWQARNRASTTDPDTIKILKDKLLRLPIEIEQHQGGGAPPIPVADPTP
jgi:hypothetical protein